MGREHRARVGMGLAGFVTFSGYLLAYTVFWNGTHLHNFNDLASPGVAENGLYLLNVTSPTRAMAVSNMSLVAGDLPELGSRAIQQPADPHIGVARDRGRTDAQHRPDPADARRANSRIGGVVSHQVRQGWDTPHHLAP